MGKMTWSWSSLSLYEQCPYAFKLKRIEKLPELPRKPDNPLERGNRVHKGNELYIKSEASVWPRESDHFACVGNRLRELYQEHIVTVEAPWYFDENWEPCEKPNAWLVMYLDVNVFIKEDKHVIVGDWKTGKMGWSLPKHAQQGQLYAAGAALKYPWADKITTEFYYLDAQDMTQKIYWREDALKYVGLFQRRVDRMYNDKIYRPHPSAMNCRWCSYGPQAGTGACPFAYKG